MANRSDDATPDPERQARLRAAAERALAEAQARREAAASRPRPTEVDGRNGPDPIRYGDWEVNGLASDF